MYRHFIYNQQWFESSKGNSTKLKMCMMFSICPGLGSHPEVKFVTSTSFLTTSLINKISYPNSNKPTCLFHIYDQYHIIGKHFKLWFIVCFAKERMNDSYCILFWMLHHTNIHCFNYDFTMLLTLQYIQ